MGFFLGSAVIAIAYVATSRHIAQAFFCMATQIAIVNIRHIAITTALRTRKIVCITAMCQAFAENLAA